MVMHFLTGICVAAPVAANGGLPPAICLPYPQITSVQMHCMFTMGCRSRGTPPHVCTHMNGCQQGLVKSQGGKGQGQ